MSQTQHTDPLVQALRRKTNHQAERINELEEEIEELREQLGKVVKE